MNDFPLDLRILAAMIEEGEEELHRGQTLQPFMFKGDPGGIMDTRQVDPPDSILDTWHPWDKVG